MTPRLIFLFSIIFTTQLMAELPESYDKNTNDELKRIIFLGDSLTAGYGLEREEAYPVLIEKILKVKGINVDVVNGGLSGDTTAGGLRRVDWVLAKGGDVLVIALGANDGLRGLNPKETKKNIIAIINRAREINPDIRIGVSEMLVPPSMGESYSQAFKEIYKEVAEEQKVVLLPFLLEGVAGDEKLNQKDGIHPTAKGQKIIAKNIAPKIMDLISK